MGLSPLVCLADATIDTNMCTRSQSVVIGVTSHCRPSEQWWEADFPADTLGTIHRASQEADATMIRCSKCGSTNVEEINVEMVFARGKAEPIYVPSRHAACLECGFAEYFLPQETLAKLRELVKS